MSVQVLWMNLIVQGSPGVQVVLELRSHHSVREKEGAASVLLAGRDDSLTCLGVQFISESDRQSS